jgi:hypothetical protein
MDEVPAVAQNMLSRPKFGCWCVTIGGKKTCRHLPKVAQFEDTQNRKENDLKIFVERYI